MSNTLTQPRYSMESKYFDIFQIYNSKVFPMIENIRGSTRLNELLKSGIVSESKHGYTFEVEGKVITLQNQYAVNPISNELEFLKYIIENKNEINHFIDIGGYTGFYSVFVSKISDSRVTCFEANPDNSEIIETNRELNDCDFDIVNNPVWDSEEKIMIKSDEGKSRVNSEGYEMDSVTLDTELSYEEVDMIKLDVEGAEMKVLEGAEKLIDNQKPVILLELHKEKRLDGFDHRSRDVIKFLELKGYDCEKVKSGEFDDLYICENNE